MTDGFYLISHFLTLQMQAREMLKFSLIIFVIMNRKAIIAQILGNRKSCILHSCAIQVSCPTFFGKVCWLFYMLMFHMLKI